MRQLTPAQREAVKAREALLLAERAAADPERAEITAIRYSTDPADVARVEAWKARRLAEKERSYVQHPPEDREQQ